MRVDRSPPRRCGNGLEEKMDSRLLPSGMTAERRRRDIQDKMSGTRESRYAHNPGSLPGRERAGAQMF